MPFTVFYKGLFNQTGYAGNSLRLFAVLLFFVGLCLPSQSIAGGTYPPGFTETVIVSGLTRPTAFAIHPDGRIFFLQQTGEVRVIKNGALLPTPFTTIAVNYPNGSERGLLGVAFDPDYATNRYVYFYYTSPTPSIHNRVSRFTADIANEDVAVAGSEVAILDLENLNTTIHNGGAIHFGTDGKLYVGVGDNNVPANSQSVANRLGKVLRINSDGTIPADNPTSFPNVAATPDGVNRAIWALGLRNPFTFNIQPGTGRIYFNDVGLGTWEEVNNGTAGANYGWSTCEGACGTSGMTNPAYQFSSSGIGNGECAVAGGAFYNPSNVMFPASYVGKYFFTDFCAGWIKYIDPANLPEAGSALTFGSNLGFGFVDVQVHHEGSLYYLSRNTSPNAGYLVRVEYPAGFTPTATASPTPTNTQTPTNTATPTNTSTPTNTPTNTATLTPTSTATETFTPTPTATETFTPTDTPTDTPTNTATATATDTPTSTPTASASPSLSGTILYGNAISGPPPPRFVSNVLLSGVGSPDVSALTDGFGTYSLTSFGAGSYTVIPTKVGSVNGITSFDAARIAQHVSATNTLTGNALIVADTSNNGSVTSFDAAKIAQFVSGGTIVPPNVTGTWRFIPVNRTYASVSTNVTGEDYVALLMGEVSGNWANTAPPSPTPTPTPPQLTVLYDYLGGPGNWGFNENSLGFAPYFEELDEENEFNVATQFIGTLTSPVTLRKIEFAGSYYNNITGQNLPLSNLINCKIKIWRADSYPFSTNASVPSSSVNSPGAFSYSIPVIITGFNTVYVLGWDNLNIPLPAEVEIELSIQCPVNRAADDIFAGYESLITPSLLTRTASRAFGGTQVNGSLGINTAVKLWVSN
ncbi:MAG: PQQ-dependent sugar dehydrogenase [Pyrinomonadaceae bacterium]